MLGGFRVDVVCVVGVGVGLWLLLLRRTKNPPARTELCDAGTQTSSWTQQNCKPEQDKGVRSAHELQVIGFVKSPFSERKGTPRHGLLVPHSRGFVELLPKFKAGLEGLDTFSHVYIVFQFHANTVSAVGSYQGMKVVPPRLGQKTGVFATRSPHRPNTIGLSVCRIDHVDFRLGRVHISGIDLCDGSPVYDLKPVVPTDIGICSSHFPAWALPSNDIETKMVSWEPQSLTDLASIVQHHSRGTGKFYRATEEDVIALRMCVEEVLQQDPRNKFERGKLDADVIGRPLTAWHLCIDGIKFKFDVKRECFVVTRVEPEKS
eukprot:c374_g1_i1.p1 GENE.c374_g1_i1~~c374_g1_i1.p1  ORF type:complete len:319 (+),score=42.04 c374_g1_i1:52-1008(+)